jgi:hypothetical protein
VKGIKLTSCMSLFHFISIRKHTSCAVAQLERQSNKCSVNSQAMANFAATDVPENCLQCLSIERCLSPRAPADPKRSQNDHSTISSSSHGLPISTLPMQLDSSIMTVLSVNIHSMPTAPGGLSLKIENGVTSWSDSLHLSDSKVVGTFSIRSSSVSS